MYVLHIFALYYIYYLKSLQNCYNIGIMHILQPKKGIQDTMCLKPLT